jgi:hypothetical protein
MTTKLARTFDAAYELRGKCAKVFIPPRVAAPAELSRKMGLEDLLNRGHTP